MQAVLPAQLSRAHVVAVLLESAKKLVLSVETHEDFVELSLLRDYLLTSRTLGIQVIVCDIVAAHDVIDCCHLLPQACIVVELRSSHV